MYKEIGSRMKKIAIWNNYVSFAQNRLFDASAYSIGEDLGYPMIHLKNQLEKLGYAVETLDMDKPENYEKIIFLDVPDPKICCCDISKIPTEKKYLILVECQLISPPNGNHKKHFGYNKVFYYNDDYVHRYGYIKLNLPNKLKTPLSMPFREKKFCTLIAGNKSAFQRGELYNQRLKTINYFEKEHPADFEFYGTGWDGHRFYGPRIVRVLNRVPYLNKILTRTHKCYKGQVDKKLDVLKQYKFAICYENSCIFPGYITEKLWDCFFAGVVPIYWGAPNITNYVPENCFIDRRKFKDNTEMYNFLQQITVEQYVVYLENIKSFLKTESARKFSAEYFAEVLIHEILG